MTGSASACPSRSTSRAGTPRRLERGRPLRRRWDRRSSTPSRPSNRTPARPRAAPTRPAPEPRAEQAAHRHDRAERPGCARPTAPTRSSRPRTAGHRPRAAAAHSQPTAHRSRHRRRRPRRAKRSREHCTAQHFGPMNSSISATDSAVRDRDVARIRLRPADAEQLAVLAEDAAGCPRRGSRRSSADTRTCDAPAGQLRLEAVHACGSHPSGSAREGARAGARP